MKNAMTVQCENMFSKMAANFVGKILLTAHFSSRKSFKF